MFFLPTCLLDWLMTFEMENCCLRRESQSVSTHLMWPKVLPQKKKDFVTRFLWLEKSRDATNDILLCPGRFSLRTGGRLIFHLTLGPFSNVFRNKYLDMISLLLSMWLVVLKNSPIPTLSISSYLNIPIVQKPRKSVNWEASHSVMFEMSFFHLLT